jgi:hypothetical protein
VDTDTAKFLLLAIIAVAAIVWMVGAEFLVRSKGAGQKDGLITSESGMSGNVDVDGQADVLATKAASILAKGALGSLKITDKTANQVVFEALGPGNRSWFRQGELRFSNERRGRCRVEWAVELPNRTWLLWLGGFFQVLGLVAVVGGSWAIYTFVVSSPDPSIRWQTLQILQVCHFLWPPFLMGGLYRRGIRDVAVQIESLANNLPYFEE